MCFKSFREIRGNRLEMKIQALKKVKPTSKQQENEIQNQLTLLEKRLAEISLGGYRPPNNFS
jgi:hypothetical protein